MFTVPVFLAATGVRGWFTGALFAADALFLPGAAGGAVLFGALFAGAAGA